MLTEPLPHTLDVRKNAAREATVSGVLNPSDLPRFRELLASDTGSVEASLALSKDEEHRVLIHVQITAQVEVLCQRCLETMPSQLQAENTVAVVWSDDQAQHLPRELDPLILEQDEACDLWELVEEELILSMPAFNYHEAQGCNRLLDTLNESEPPAADESSRPNPFNVLEQLKPGPQK